MVLNRKSAKQTSRVSLFVAVAMLSMVAIVVQTQGYQIEHLAQNGAEMCKVGIVDLVVSMLW